MMKNKRSIVKCGFMAVGLLLASTGGLFAQRTLTSISGTVIDPSGAVVPEARVQAISESTGISATGITDSKGFYVITHLAPSTYRLSVQRAGFKSYAQAGIVLEVDQPVSINVHLQLGSETQTVSVQSDAAQVNVQNNVLSTVVTSAMSRDLPLNGRDVLQLMTVAPDTSPSMQPGTKLPYQQSAARPDTKNDLVSASGGRGNSTAFYLDGGIDEDPYDQIANVFPNPDAIQEFSYDTSNYSARFGGRGGGVVNAVTRSGTNEFHGDAFEFIRNTDLNARNYFAAGQDGLKRNQYGFTLGGPIQKGKTFFFAAWQGTKLRSASTENFAVTPTEVERNGDFSQIKSQLVNPTTRMPYAGNQIPVSSFDPVASKLLSLVPVGAPGTGLVEYTTINDQNDNQWIGHLDHSFGEKFQASARYLYDEVTQPSSVVPGNVLSASTTNDWRSQLTTLNGEYIFRSNLITTLSATLDRVVVTKSGPPVFPGWSELGVNVPNLVTGGSKKSLQLQISGYFSPSWDGVYRFPRSEYQLDDNWTYIRGGHTFQFGGDLKLHERTTGDQDNGAEGDFTFNSKLSGDNLVDFMLGVPSLFEQSLPTYYVLQRTVPALYATDTWKVGRRLSLDLGVRWNPFVPLRETSDNKMAIFSWSAYSAGTRSVRFPAAPPGLLFGGDPGVPDAGVKSNYALFEPRVGFAYDVFGNGRTGIRGGFGFYNDEPYGNADNGPATSPPFTVSSNIPFPTGGLDNPYLGQTNPFSGHINFADVPISEPFSEYVFDPSMTYPTIMQWNFTVEQQVGSSLMIRAAYEGSESYHMFLALNENGAVYIPGQSTLQNVQARRPLGQYFTTLGVGSTLATNSYNAFVISAEKRMSKGLSFVIGYRASKCLDEVSSTDFGLDVADPTNLKFSRGLCDYDIPSKFTASYVWHTPSVQSLGFLGRHIVGGWEPTGILSIRSGFPYTVYSGLQNSMTGTSSKERADLVGNPALTGNRSTPQKLAEWFNTAAFTNNAVGTFGDSSRNFLRGPGFADLDFGLLRSFPIERGPFAQTQRVEFRAEAFNIFNHPNFNSPGASVGTSTFGKVLAATDPRILQFSLKYLF